MSSWAELQRLIVRSRCVDGDIGVIRRKNGRLQVFMSDELSNPQGREWDPMFRDGVELDADGSPFAFHLAVTDSLRSANRRYSHKRVRVPARHVSFLPRRQSEDQTRGLSVFAQNVHLFEHLDKLIEAVVVAARMAACYGLVIQTPLGPPTSGQSEEGEDGVERILEKFWPGMVHYTEAGETIQQLQPNQSLEKLNEAIRPILRTIGLPLGMPLEVLLMDMSGLNYSMSRGLMLQVFRVIEPEQQFLVNHLCEPTWRWLNLRWIAEGKLPPDPRLLLAEWIPPKRDLIDPFKDLQAMALALDLGLTDEDKIATSMGVEWKDVAVKRAEILRRKAELGLPIVASTATREPGKNAETDDEEDKSKSDGDEDEEENEDDDESEEDEEDEDE